MDRRYFTIGDLHGHYDELMALYKKLLTDAKFVPEKDTMIFLGDYCDYGSQSKEVVDQLMKWQETYPHWQFLKGNHCEMMVDALDPKHLKYGDYYIWWNQGGEQTLKSYQPKGELSEYQKSIMQPKDIIPADHLQWLAGLIYFYETEDYFFVHAGVVPGLPLKKQDLYHPVMQDNMLWIRDEFINSDFDWGKKIIFGHTGNEVDGFYKPIVMKNKIGLNTLPRNEGYLSALEIPGEKFWRV